MLEFIKKSYISTIEGVINTETEWKITSDRQGLNILDSIPMSSDAVNSFESDIIISENTSVYIWYKLKLSNGEVKDWIGPIEYVSRSSNISNDLRPITRVKTPTIYWNNDDIVNGNLPLVVNSSEFKGDSLDGHLATTWIFKTPDDKILTYSMFNTMNRLSYSLNRNSLNLSKYDYITCYIKHHGADGACSDFGVIDIPTRIYPFKYIGDLVIDNRDTYLFSLMSFSDVNPSVDLVEFKDSTTGKIVYSVDTSTIWSNITIQPNTFKPDNKYIIICHLQDSDRYSNTLELELRTTKVKDMVEYNNTLEYDINNLNIIDKNIVIDDSVTGVGRLISNQSIVSISNNLYKILYDGNIDIIPLTIQNDVYSAMTLDYKIFNISNTTLFMLYRVGDKLILSKLIVIDNDIKFDNTATNMEFMIDDTDHNLKYNSSISEDGKYIYSLYRLGDVIGLISFNTSTGVVSILDSISTLVSNILLTKTIVISASDRKITLIDITTGLWYNLNIGHSSWVELGVLPDSFKNFTGEYKYIVLADRSILFLNVFNSKIIRIKTNLKIEESDIITESDIINNANIVLLDSRGVLTMINSYANKLVLVEPKEII